MNHNLDDVFNECLEQMLKGEALESCLERYPDYAHDLKPLLLIASSTREVSQAQLNHNLKDTFKNRLLSSLQADKVQPVPISIVWRSAWFTALAIVVVVIVIMTGTVVAASSSMPNGILYPVKLASEQVRFAFLTTTSAKLAYTAELANERVSELIYELGSSDGDAIRVEAAVTRLDSVLTQIRNLAHVNDEQWESDQETTLADIHDKEKLNLIKALALYAVTNSQILQEQVQAAPDTVRPAIENAINQTVSSFDRAIKAIEEGQTKP